MIDLIYFNNKSYPAFQAEGNAAQFAIPFAKKVCNGVGVDVGCNRIEWMFSGDLYGSDTNKYHNYNTWLETAKKQDVASYPIDPVINGYTATEFPEDCNNLDYIFSSHCLEHLDNWVTVLDYWYGKLKHNGVIFLYLPDYSQEYWRPWNNRKHLNILTPQILTDYFKHKKCVNIFSSERDLNNSFMIIAQKNENT